MVIDDFLEIGKIRAKSKKFEQKWYQAVADCAQQIKEHQKPYVSVSGGKDSGVLAYLVAAAARIAGKEVRIWCHVSDASFPGTEETVREIARQTGLPLDFSRCPFSAFDYLAETDQRKAFGKSGVFYSAVREYAKDKDLSFVGVRACESRRRMKAAKVNGDFFHSRAMGDIDVSYPLLWFSLYDVAAATVRFDIPLHPIYRKQPVNLGKNALGEDAFIRLGYITSRDLLNKGTTVFLRLNYPEIFAKLAEVWPDIRNET